jgi:hypothetical protein
LPHRCIAEREGALVEQEDVFSQEESTAVLAAALRARASGLGPAELLLTAVDAERWALSRIPAEERTSWTEWHKRIPALIAENNGSINASDQPDVFDSPTVRRGLRWLRACKLVGQEMTPGVLDEIGSVLTFSRDPGKPRRPLFRRLGDAADFGLYQHLHREFVRVHKCLPPELKETDSILRYVEEQGQICPEREFRPALARQLSIFRKDRLMKKGKPKPEEAAAYWFFEVTRRRPVEDFDGMEEALREVRRLQKNAKAEESRLREIR